MIEFFKRDKIKKYSIDDRKDNIDLFFNYPLEDRLILMAFAEENNFNISFPYFGQNFGEKEYNFYIKTLNEIVEKNKNGRMTEDEYISLGFFVFIKGFMKKRSEKLIHKYEFYDFKNIVRESEDFFDISNNEIVLIDKKTNKIVRSHMDIVPAVEKLLGFDFKEDVKYLIEDYIKKYTKNKDFIDFKEDVFFEGEKALIKVDNLCKNSILFHIKNYTQGFKVISKFLDKSNSIFEKYSINRKSFIMNDRNGIFYEFYLKEPSHNFNLFMEEFFEKLSDVINYVNLYHYEEIKNTYEENIKIDEFSYFTNMVFDISISETFLNYYKAMKREEELNKKILCGKKDLYLKEKL